MYNSVIRGVIDEYVSRLSFFICLFKIKMFVKNISPFLQALIWIILLIVGAIVLLGLFILLAWKCWTTYAVSYSIRFYNSIEMNEKH